MFSFCSRKRSKDSIYKDILTEMETAERTLIDKYSGLKVGKTIHIYNVQINLKGASEYIHTYRAGDGQKDDLVLIHGYLYASGSFYKMLADLAQHYRLWVIDLVGMGLSSRPEFTCTSTEETIDYFLESLEQWRETVGLERFHLAGHSFGGYMSGQYALRYPDRVKKLMLISPAGVTKGTTQINREAFLAGHGFIRRKIMGMAFDMWERKITPHGLADKFSLLKNTALKRYLKSSKLTGEELSLSFTYLAGVFKLPESTLKALHFILAMPRAAGVLPLEDLMHEFKMPCEIYYGKQDWMSTEGSFRVLQKGDLKGDIYIIPDAGHKINFDNPKYLTALMIEHKLKEDDPQIVTKKDSFGPKVVDLEYKIIQNDLREEEELIYE